MKKNQMKKSKLLNLKYVLFLSVIITLISCTPEETECETEIVCYGDGNCIEKPIPGTCFN